jgi:cardiolipin hydrolase
MRNTVMLILLGVIFSTEAYAKKSNHALLEEAARDADSLTTSAPKDNETCFSPDEPCAGKIIKFIQTAKTSLDIAIFEMTDQKIAKAIVEAAKTVRVRMVVNRKLVKDTGPAYDLLKSAHVPIRVGKQKGIMHNKFTIVDGKRLETGSFNYTYRAETSNQENQFYVGTPSVVARYHERFEKMWSTGKE